MTAPQKTIKYSATTFAILLTISITVGLLITRGLSGCFFGGGAVTDGIQTYAVSSDIRGLEVNITAADFTIRQGDKIFIESNLKYLTVEEKNGVLSIKETKKFEGAYNDALLTLYIPDDTMFEKISVKTGAGKLTVERLSSDTVNLELGAGEAAIKSLIAVSDAAIVGGAGKITIAGGELHNLDLDMGIGQLNLTSVLTGDCFLDLGVGESNITVIGDRENYNLNIKKGIGSITVDGADVSGLNEQGDNGNSIDIRGGVGAVNLKFKGFPTN